MRTPGKALLVIGVLLGAALTVRLPVVATVGLLVALDVGLLIYRFSDRTSQYQSFSTRMRSPMCLLAEVISVSGALLVGSALWLTMLGVLTQVGVTNEATANWGRLAMMGFQVAVDQPALFGARCLVVAAAVWAVGFGLTKATARK